MFFIETTLVSTAVFLSRGMAIRQFLVLSDWETDLVWHGQFSTMPLAKLRSVRREISTDVNNTETALQIGKIKSSFMFL